MYLRVIGATDISKEDKRLHPTATGMLLFGNKLVLENVGYFWRLDIDIYFGEQNNETGLSDRLARSDKKIRKTTTIFSLTVLY